MDDGVSLLNYRDYDLQTSGTDDIGRRKTLDKIENI